MSIFKAAKAFGGTATTFGPSYPSIDLMLDIGTLRRQHSGALVLKGALATEKEIDIAIDDLERDLESLRSAAKTKLKSYVDEARPTTSPGGASTL